MSDPTNTSHIPLVLHVLWKSNLVVIGDIIRTCADIDFLISLALFKKLGLSFSNGLVLFGSMSIGTKLGKLVILMKNDKNQTNYKKFEQIQPKLDAFIKLRNTLAHGILVGAKKDAIVFMVTDRNQFDGEEAIIIKYRDVLFKDMQDHRKRGELLREFIKDLFQLPASSDIAYQLYHGHKDPNQ